MNIVRLANTTNQIDTLSKQLQEAKSAEAKAAQFRREIEQSIIELCGVSQEGSTTFKGEQYKIVTTGKITRSIDQEQLKKAWESLPDAAKDAIRYKPEIIKKEFDALKKHNEPAWRALCECVTEKEAKPSVSFAEIEKTK